MISLIRQITGIKEIYGNEVRAIIHISPECYNLMKKYKNNTITNLETVERKFMGLPVILDVNLKELFRLEILNEHI